MANAVGMIGGSSSWVQLKNSRARVMREKNRARVCSVSASGATVSDPYKTLRINPGASKSEIKKAFRQLALQYHPDVCRGNSSGVQFHHINDAYDVLMSQLRGESTKPEMEAYEPYDTGVDEPMMGMDDPDWDLWEEWMGWEGAGIRDYSSHINPYL